ncbi:hypothetical protein, partial [uncultured Thiodictyon sp.]|uniref:hypothetical protein n=1 Tax=uncultured Thiodictyon sp. TaxID=1846217 RepID=UPI0025DF3668
APFLRGIVNQPFQHRRASARGCCAYLFALPPRTRLGRPRCGGAGIADLLAFLLSYRVFCDKFGRLISFFDENGPFY